MTSYFYSYNVPYYFCSLVYSAKSDFFRKETEFTISAEVEILVPENTTDPRLPSPVVVVSVNINSVYKFILFDFLILNSTVCMLEDSFRSKVLHEYFLLQKKGIFQYLGHRDGLPRDAPVFGDTSREPTAFPADKFHGPIIWLNTGVISVLSSLK